GLGFLAFTAHNIEAWPDPARTDSKRFVLLGFHNSNSRCFFVQTLAACRASRSVRRHHQFSCTSMRTNACCAAPNQSLSPARVTPLASPLNGLVLTSPPTRLRCPAVEPMGQFLNGSHVTRSGSARQFPRHSKTESVRPWRRLGGPVYASLPNNSE